MLMIYVILSQRSPSFPPEGSERDTKTAPSPAPVPPFPLKRPPALMNVALTKPPLRFTAVLALLAEATEPALVWNPAAATAAIVAYPAGLDALYGVYPR